MLAPTLQYGWFVELIFLWTLLLETLLCLPGYDICILLVI
jgi:hypothetical protein